MKIFGKEFGKKEAKEIIENMHDKNEDVSLEEKTSKENKKEEKSSLRDTVNFITGKEEEKTEKESFMPGFFEFASKVWNSDDLKKEKTLWGKASSVWKNYQEAKSREGTSLNVYERISEAAALNGEFIVLLIGSVLVATFGLLQNSTAVIIGAMIIAPLMMPILGFALGSIWGDFKLLSRSLITLIAGVLVSVIISAFISFLVPGNEYNNEILSRTGPNLFDVLVALASGFVGAYAYVNPRISPSISGVAIAVALMPPLCTIGITLGNQDFSLAIGATILFLINMVAIALAASLVFWRKKIHPATDSQKVVKTRAIAQIAFSSVFLIALSIPVTIFMIDSFRSRMDYKKAMDYISQQIPEAEIDQCELKPISNEAGLLKCTLIVPSYISKKQVEEIQQNVKKLFHKETEVKFTTLAVFNFSGDLESQIDRLITENIHGEILKYELSEKAGQSDLDLIVLAEKYPRQKVFQETQKQLQELLGDNAKISLRILKGLGYENEEKLAELEQQEEQQEKNKQNEKSR